MPSLDQAAILAALRGVRDPDLEHDVVTLGFVKHLSINGDRVAFTLEFATPLSPSKQQVKNEAVAAVRAVSGVGSVEVALASNIRSATQPETGHTPLPGVKNVIAVGAGKGGVGKTTVSVNLALALARCGCRVGLLDADIYGPNVPIMLGMRDELATDGQKIVPAEKNGVQVVSMGFLTSDDQAVIWRGPMLHGAVQQFFREVAWKDLDYLVVDLPPGTGDIVLSLSQTVPAVGAIVVTTPQRVSLADSRRAVRMYQKLNVPTLGVIENMSYYACPNCHHETDIFGHGGGEEMAREVGVPFLGRLPLYQPIREGGDSGVPVVIAEPDSPASRAFVAVAERVAAHVAKVAQQAALANKGKIPLIPVK